MSVVRYALVLLSAMGAASQQVALTRDHFGPAASYQQRQFLNLGQAWREDSVMSHAGSDAISQNINRVDQGSAQNFVLDAATHNPSSKLAEKDTILLADFTNHTDDKVFDGALEQALRMALDESPFLNILSEASVTGTLKQMALPANAPVTPDVARALCQRTSSKAYIAGAITGTGTEFAVGLQTVDCVSGETMAQVQSTARGKEKILDAMGEAVSNLRIQLGEPLASVRRFNTPLPRATTASLEALRAWSMGIRTQEEKGAAAAIPVFESAIKLDPNFPGAIFGLGVMYRNLGQEARAREFYTKAFALRDRASAREKFRIAGQYYSFVTVEYQKAVETYREWMKSYPRDEKPVLNLGALYGDVCQYEQAIAQFSEARRLNPSDVIAHEDLIEILAATGQFGRAQEAYQEMLRMKLDDDSPHVFMYSVAFLQHDAKQMAQQAGWFEGKPELQHEVLSEEADAEAYVGRLARARELTAQAVQSALRADNQEQAAAWQLNSAWREDLLGNTREAHEQAVRALAMAPESREDEAVAAILLARTGDIPKANAIVKDLEKRYPLHMIVQSYWLPCIRAQIALARKDPASALQQLRTAASFDVLFPQVTYYSHMPSVVLRAEAYSAAGQPAAAAKEWETILRKPGIVQLSATAPLARLQLARVYAVQAGIDTSQRARARAAYLDFLSLWEHADPDIPILEKAKAELARLQ